MPKNTSKILDTPPGMKRCKHCTKNNNRFLDVREKHNECDSCRLTRQKTKDRKRHELAGLESPLDVNGWESETHLQPAPSVSKEARSVVVNGKRSTIHGTTADTVEIFNTKEDAFAMLMDHVANEETFRFHGRFVARDLPDLSSPDEEERRQLIIKYIHAMNSEIGDCIGWRWTSRGRETKKNTRKVIAVHYNCCQDAARSKASKTVREPNKIVKRKPMERYNCNGRMTIAFELEHDIIEIRVLHEVRHPAYKGKRSALLPEAEPMALAGPSGMPMMMQVAAPLMMDAQQASLLYGTEDEDEQLDLAMDLQPNGLLPLHQQQEYNIDPNLQGPGFIPIPSYDGGMIYGNVGAYY